MEDLNPYSSFTPAACAFFPDAYASAKPFSSMPVALRVRYAIAAFLSSEGFAVIDVGVDIWRREYWSQLITFSQFLATRLNASDTSGIISYQSARRLGLLHGVLTQMEYFLRFGNISTLTNERAPEDFRDAMSLLRSRTQRPEEMDGPQRLEIATSTNLWFDIARILRDAVLLTGDALLMWMFHNEDPDVDLSLSLIHI